MAELFQTTKQNVSLHIQNIFDERELERVATVKESLTVQREGTRSVQRRVEFYNLDVIISVGYRVKSHRGTQFRMWATQRLREYIVKGFVLFANGGTGNGKNSQAGTGQQGTLQGASRGTRTAVEGPRGTRARARQGEAQGRLEDACTSFWPACGMRTSIRS